MSASITATVTQSVSMQGAPFSSVSTSISGETANIIETTLASTSSAGSGGTPVSMSGVGFAEAKLQLLYLLSDAADVDVIFTGSTSGTATIRCAAGVAAALQHRRRHRQPARRARGHGDDDRHEQRHPGREQRFPRPDGLLGLTLKSKGNEARQCQSYRAARSSEGWAGGSTPARWAATRPISPT